jgi:hypothetical protein
MKQIKLSQTMACRLMVMLALPVVAMSDSSSESEYGSESEYASESEHDPWFQFVYYNHENKYQAPLFEEKYPLYAELYRHMCSSLGNAKDALMNYKKNPEGIEENLKDCFLRFDETEKEDAVFSDIKQYTIRFVNLFKIAVNVKNFNVEYKYQDVFFRNFYMFCQTLENIKNNNPDARFSWVNIDAVLKDCAVIKKEMAQFSDQQLLNAFSDAVSAEESPINAFVQSLEKKKEGGMDLQSIIPRIKEVNKFSTYIVHYFKKKWNKADRLKDFLFTLNGMSYNRDTEIRQDNLYNRDTEIRQDNPFYSNSSMMQWIYRAFQDTDMDLCKNFATVLKAIYQSVFESQFLNFSSFTDLEKQKMRPDEKTEDLISKLTNNLDQSQQYSPVPTHEDFDWENSFTPKNHHSPGESSAKESIDGNAIPSADAEHHSDDHVLFAEKTASLGKRSRSPSFEGQNLKSDSSKRQKTKDERDQ